MSSETLQDMILILIGLGLSGYLFYYAIPYHLG